MKFLQEAFLWWAWIFPSKEVYVVKQIWITFVVKVRWDGSEAQSGAAMLEPIVGGRNFGAELKIFQAK
jgi:hypothetical protein